MAFRRTVRALRAARRTRERGRLHVGPGTVVKARSRPRGGCLPATRCDALRRKVTLERGGFRPGRTAWRFLALLCLRVNHVRLLRHGGVSDRSAMDTDRDGLRNEEPLQVQEVQEKNPICPSRSIELGFDVRARSLVQARVGSGAKF